VARLPGVAGADSLKRMRIAINTRFRYKREPGFHYFDDSREGMPLVRVDMDSGILHKVKTWSRVSALSRYVRQNLGLSATYRRLRDPKLRYVGNVAASVTQERIERSERAVDAFLMRLPDDSGVPVRRIVFVVDGIRPDLYTEEELRKAQGSYFDTMRRYFSAQATELGYTSIDMQPRFRERHRLTGERFEYPDDAHWNEAGHAMVAEAVKETRVFRDRFAF
jgi:hypothetical protein